MTRSLLLCFITLLNRSLPPRCETPAVSGGKKYRPLSSACVQSNVKVRIDSILWEYVYILQWMAIKHLRGNKHVSHNMMNPTPLSIKESV